MVISVPTLGAPAVFSERDLSVEELRAYYSGDPLAIARSQIGVTERTHPERIGEYLHTVGQPADVRIPWCAAFVCWTLEVAGYAHLGAPNAKSFLKWGVPGTRRPGALVVFHRGDPSSWTGHVGYVAPEDSHSNPDPENQIMVLSGNQDNGVNVMAYPVADVVGYRERKYMSRSKTVYAGLTAAVSQTGAEALREPSFAETLQSEVLPTLERIIPGIHTSHVRTVLILISLGCTMFMIYDRFLKNRRAGV